MARFIVITDGYSPEVRMLADRIVVVEELDHDQFRWVVELPSERETLLTEAASTAHIERTEPPRPGLLTVRT
jgi:hypothetical protein